MRRLIILSILWALTLSTYSQNKFNKKSKKEGCISGDCKNGQGTYVYDNGEKYVGQWKDEGFHGQGTYTYADGTIEKGLWEENVYANSNFPGMKEVLDTIFFYFTKLRVLEFNDQTDTIKNEPINEDKYFDIEIKYGDILVLDLSDAGGESY